MYALVNASGGDRDLLAALRKDEEQSPTRREYERLAFKMVSKRVLELYAAHLEFRRVPEEAKAEACYEAAMGHYALDEGPLTIILSYLQKEDHEN